MSMFDIHTIPIEIDAPAEFVWEVLTDTARYGEWNPFTPKANSDFKIGSPAQLLARMWPGHFRITETVCAFEQPRLLAWSRSFGPRWLLFAVREQRIEVLRDSRSSYHNVDRLSGLLAPLVWLTLGGYMRRGFTDAGLGLKPYAEAKIAARTDSATHERNNNE